MYRKFPVSFLILTISFGLFKETSAGSASREDLQDIVMKERNQQLCEGPLHTNCPRDGKILGDLSWSPFSNDPSPDDAPPEDLATPAEVEGIVYRDPPHPLES